jgi:hypothetical protein
MAKLVTINAKPVARDALRTLAFTLTGATGRRVTMSDALTAACARASVDIDATIAALPPDEETDQ